MPLLALLLAMLPVCYSQCDDFAEVCFRIPPQLQCTPWLGT